MFRDNNILIAKTPIPQKNDLTIWADHPFSPGSYRMNISVPNMSGVRSEKEFSFKVKPCQPKLFATIGETLQGTATQYLPISIQNSGDAAATNLMVETSLCFMKDIRGNDYYETDFVPGIREAQNTTIEFRVPEAIQRFNAVHCEPAINYQAKGLASEINLYDMLKGAISDQNILACGNCPYTIQITANGKKFPPFKGIIRAPIYYNFKYDGNYSDANKSGIDIRLRITPLE